MATGISIPQTIREIFAELQRIRSQPVGTPPTRAGAEELAEILRPAPGQAAAGGIADKVFKQWGATAIKGIDVNTGVPQQQIGFAGQPVANPPSVVITDGNKVPVKVRDILVTFRVSGGGGVVTPTEVPTDANGVATLGSWTLGAKGDNAVIAVAGTASVIFTAIAVTALTAVSPTDQSAPAGSNVGHPPVVKVTDHAGRPVAGVDVQFTVAAGAGKVKPSKVTTGADGLATCVWTLDIKPVANALDASCGPFTVRFTAMGV